jgi:hypothetical protein
MAVYEPKIVFVPTVGAAEFVVAAPPPPMVIVN